jgi:hypothetical protein
MSRSKKKCNHANQAQSASPQPNATTNSKGEEPTIPVDQYEIYRDERKTLYAAEEAYAERFDKWIVTLAGGALAVSMAFVKDLVQPHLPVDPILLFVAWIAFGVAILLSLLCTLLCQRAREKFRDALDAAFREPRRDPLRHAAELQAKRWEPTCIMWLNRFNVVVFVVAVVVLGLFIYRNLDFVGGP